MLIETPQGSYDIVIGGGGVVGLTLACLLGQYLEKSLGQGLGQHLGQGLEKNSKKELISKGVYKQAPKVNLPKILLIDRETFNDQEGSGNLSENFQDQNLQDQNNLLDAQYDPRVVALSLRSRQILMQLGLWQSITESGVCRYSKMHVWDGQGTGNIQFNAADARLDELGHIVENRTLLHILKTHVAQLKYVDILPACNIMQVKFEGSREFGENAESGAHIDVLANTAKGDDLKHSFNTKLLVAADGANSYIRQAANFSMREWDYNHTAIFATLKTTKSHNNTAWQRFTDNGPIAFLPLPDKLSMEQEKMNALESGKQNFSSLVWSVETKKADILRSMNKQNFMQALSYETEYILGDIKNIGQRYYVPLRQKHAKQYWRKNCVLVGDAAHVIHPLAGQGVNLGLYDVDVLSQEIFRALEKNISLEQVEILQRYERQRMGHNLQVMASMEGFKKIFEIDYLPVRFLRNLGMSMLNKHFLVKRYLTKIASGL